MPRQVRRSPRKLPRHVTRAQWVARCRLGQLSRLEKPTKHAERKLQDAAETFRIIITRSRGSSRWHGMCPLTLTTKMTRSS